MGYDGISTYIDKTHRFQKVISWDAKIFSKPNTLVRLVSNHCTGQSFRFLPEVSFAMPNSYQNHSIIELP